jgi:tetratricopeptide (TPR) repeat protein
MGMSALIKQFDALTRKQILALLPGMWSDEDLLEALKHFESEKEDRDRAMAVAELILHSPQMVDIDYSMLYLDLNGYYRWKGDFPAALRWAHTLITFGEQHKGNLNRANHVRDLAETYLEAGDRDTGLALFTRLAQASPGDIWNYNTLGFALPRVGLPGLALEVLDSALAFTAKNDPDHLKKQLTDQRREIEKSLSGAPDYSGEISLSVLADFRAALLPPVPPTRRKSSGHEEAAPYLPPITRLLAVGPAGDTTLEAEILAQGKVLIPELIRLAFDEELPAHGAPTHAVQLLRQLRDAQAAGLGELSAWLDQASGDWRNELLTRRFAKIGGYTTSELETIVADVQANSSTRINASEALAERVKQLPALRERFIAFIRTMLTRPEADSASEEMIVGFLISDARRLEAHELYPEIERAFTEDRVDTSIISPLDMKHRGGSLPVAEPVRRTDGMYLRLRCTACNRIREHFVQNVLLDLDTLEQEKDGKTTAYDPHIMDHVIVCPKCGAVDHYAMTPQANLAILVLPNKLDNLTALFAGKKSISDLPPNPRLHPFRSTVFGQPMHPLAGLEEYRRRIAANPIDAKLYMRMGTLLRTLYRYSPALEAHRQAYGLNPNDAEIALVLGFSEHDFGDQSAAKEMYERVLALELKGKGTWGITRSDTFAGAAMEGLDLLKRHQPSAWALPAYNPATGKKTTANLNAQSPSTSSRKHRHRKGH